MSLIMHCKSIFVDILCIIVRNWKSSAILSKVFFRDVAGRIRFVGDEKGIMPQSIL
jgi:hypothetical protein